MRIPLKPLTCIIGKTYNLQFASNVIFVTKPNIVTFEKVTEYGYCFMKNNKRLTRIIYRTKPDSLRHNRLKLIYGDQYIESEVKMLIPYNWYVNKID